MYFWYSAKQKEALRDNRTICYVQVDGEWTEYTELTQESKPSGLWDDYKLLISGKNIPTKYSPNPFARRGRDIDEESSGEPVFHMELEQERYQRRW